MEALKPCPHCGNDGSGPIEDALHVQHNEPFEWNDRHTWTVQCDKCTATMGYFDREEEAIVAWNLRAPSPDPRPAAQPGVVKGLEWIEAEGNYPGQTVWSPKNDIWPCWIVKNLNSDSYIWCEEIGIELAPASPVMGGFQSLDAAKAAAQADYERRILSQIDFAALADPVSQEPVAVPFPGSIMCGCDGATCPDGCKHCNPDLQRKAIEELASQFGASPLTEGEPSEAEVERAAKAMVLCLWSDTGSTKLVFDPKRPVPYEFRGVNLKKVARAALLAAKSKGGQADG